MIAEGWGCLVVEQKKARERDSEKNLGFLFLDQA
jgi:hypothetical protein